MKEDRQQPSDINVVKNRDADSARELTEQVAQLRILVDAAFEGIGVTQNGLVIEANEQLMKMLGYERAEMIGVPVMNFVVPESRDSVRRAIESNRSESFEHLALRKDGTVFPVEVRGRMIGRLEDRTRATVVRDITARREADDQLKTLTQRLKLATAAAAIAVWDWDLGTNAAICDERLFEIYGLPHDPNGRLTFEQWARLVHPEDLPTQEAALQRTIREKGHGFREFRIIRPDGAQRHIQSAEAVITDARGTPVRVVGMNIDITERKQAEAALRQSEERFRAVVEFSPIAVAVAVDERLVYVNPAGARLAGATGPGDLAKIIGRSVYDFIPAELQNHARERRTKVLEQGTPAPTIERSLLHPDGSTFMVEATAVPFVFAGQPAILNLIRDITERKRSEEERAQTLVREQQAQEQFTRQMIASQEAERTRIAAELHDSLGQNLLLIKNHAQLALQDMAASTHAQGQLETIRALASQAIAEMSQISHDLYPYQLDHLGLTRALEAMIDSTAGSSGVVFERKLDQVDEVFAKDAATNIYRVVQEGLNNILKHSAARRARIEMERDVREVVLRIEDDGLGFDAERSDGGGLGLRNISQRVRLLGGKLVVGSGSKRGTRLEVTIPIAGLE